MFVGAERLIPEALAAGAAGAVSGLASAFPEAVAEVVHRPDPAGGERLNALRSSIERYPFQGALKVALRARGVAIEADVRAPLPPLRPDQAREVSGASRRRRRWRRPRDEAGGVRPRGVRRRGRVERGRSATAPMRGGAWPSTWAPTRTAPT